MELHNFANTGQAPAQGGKRPWGRKLAKLGGLIVLIAVAYVVVCAGKWAHDKWMTMRLATSEYQSVFLTNGQVYFGKLEFKGGWVVMRNVYYLQVTEDLQSSDTAQDPQQNIQLVKLGNELHGPEDLMYIEKDKVLFWENMKDDAKVMQSIRQAQ